MKMLKVHTDLKSVPMDRYIIANDLIFNAYGKISDTDFSRKVLEVVEHGKYLNEFSFISRNGVVVSKNDLSTGSKTLFNVVDNPNMCVNLDECGYNVFDLLQYIDDGEVFWRYPIANIRNDAVKVYWVDEDLYFDSLDSFLDAVEINFRGTYDDV